MLDQRRLHRPGLPQDSGGQPVDRAADQSRVPIGDRALSDRGGDLREPRRQRLARHRPPRPQLRRQPHPPGGLPPADPQPLGQQHRRRRTPRLGRTTARLQLGHHRVPDRGPPPRINLKSGQQLQQLITAERGQVNITQLLPRRGQVTERGIDPI